MLAGMETSHALGRSDDSVGYRKALVDRGCGSLFVHVYATPAKVKEHTQVTLHKVVLNRIRVHAVARVREHSVVLNLSSVDFMDIVLKVVG